jgi:upstream activation factor subunit UAF30
MTILSSLYTILDKNRNQIQHLTAENRAIQKRIEELALNYVAESDTEEEEEVVKQSPTNRKHFPARAQSGFIRPIQINRELAEFLGVPAGTLMARIEVTRMINKYIREHGLQDKVSRRKINPDEKLKALFKLDDAMELTYFNLQKYMSRHFV